MTEPKFTDEDKERFRRKWTSRSPQLASDKELKMLALLARLEAEIARREAAEELTEIALRELEGSVFFKDQARLDAAIRQWRERSGK